MSTRENALWALAALAVVVGMPDAAVVFFVLSAVNVGIQELPEASKKKLRGFIGELGEEVRVALQAERDRERGIMASRARRRSRV
jgi:hypothetical protein